MIFLGYSKTLSHFRAILKSCQILLATSLFSYTSILEIKKLS